MLNWIKNLFTKSSKKRFTDDYEFNSIKKENEDELNRILDKISEKGIKSLTKKEKEFLNSNKK